MNIATRPRSYSKLLDRLSDCACALGAQFRNAGSLDGFPIMLIETPSVKGPRLLIDAGIHGDEPASILGLTDWLQKDAGNWIGRLNISVFPCINPYGFENETRGGRESPDLNRQFDQQDAPLTGILACALAGKRYDLAMDLHEDRDFSEFYMYELRRSPPYLAPQMLSAAAEFAPLAHDREVGTRRTDHGLIRLPTDERTFKARRGWPIAFFLFRRCSYHVITPETPGRQPLNARNDIHRVLLNAACAFLAGRKETT